MFSVKIRVLLSSAFFVGFLAMVLVHANAEEPKQAVAAAAPEDQKAPEKGIAQLVLLADELVERSSVLQREIENLFDKYAADAALAGVGKSLIDLSSRLSKLKATKRYNYDQVVQIKTAALADSKNVKRLLDSINQSALQLETWGTEWRKEKKRWTDLKSTLPKDVPQAVLKPAVAKGQQAIDGTLALLSRQLGPLLEAQQKFADQRTKLGKLIHELDGLLQRALKDIFRRSAPSMLSVEYYSHLFKHQPYEGARQFKELADPAREYLSKYGWALVLQVIAFLLIAHGIRSHQRVFEGHERWKFLSKRPMAVGLFTAVIFLGWLPWAPIPPAVRLASMAVLSLSTARMASGFIPDLRVRRIIYIMAVLLIITDALEILEIPLPLFRLYTFFIAIGGLLFGTRILLRRTPEGSQILLWVFRAGTALFAIVFFAELFGYNDLSCDLVECSLKSVLSLAVCWMVMSIIRGVLEWSLYRSPIRSVAILRNKAEVILRTSIRIIGFFLGLLLLATNLFIWGIYESPVGAIHGLLSIGVAIGTWRITLGLILTVGVILYAALLASRAVQTALTEGLFSMRGVQMGARFSIARLIHYAFVLIGVLLALAALGVDLQNITILAGALGVGIGFGLQGIVNNFVCGLILLFERPIKVGDLVEINSEWAQIKRIGLRATIVETFDQAEVVVPNSELVNNRVKNWTLTHRGSRLTIPVGVAYGSDVSQVLQTLKECAEETPLVVKTRPPMALFTKFGESSLDFELRVYTEVDHRLKVQSDLLQNIERRFREGGIEIPFPQRDLHIRSNQPLTVVESPKSDSRVEELRPARATGFLPSS